jgi:hypothetical protein
MKKNVKDPRLSMKVADAKRLIVDRPALAELFQAFRLEASRPPHAIGDAAAVAIAVAFKLGQLRGIEQSADRLGGVVRSLELEAADHGA